MQEPRDAAVRELGFDSSQASATPNNHGAQLLRDEL